VVLIVGCNKQQPIDAADVIYAGGDIVTVNDRQPTAEALAVKGTRILAVGSLADVEKLHKGAGTRLVDLGGKALLPAFVDAHSHYISSLTVANQVNVYAPPAGPGKDPESIVAELVKYRDRNAIPKGQVIQAYGYDENVMPNGRLLNRDDLDSRAGAVIGADQRVTALEGLKAQTINVAQQYGEQATKGSLEPGKLADLVILDRNPLKVEPMSIKDIKVVETIKEGKTIYQAQ
jgi:predicted amidohydrolase YtcJ